MDTLFRYYFCEGRDLGDLDVLVEAAASVGVDRTRQRRCCAAMPA